MNTKFILIKTKFYHQRLFGNMPAKPNVCVVLQCRQITFKGEGTKYLKKGTYIIIIIIFEIIIIKLFNIAVAADNDDKISKKFLGCTKKVFKSGTSVSIFQRHSGCYLLYGRIETISRIKVFTIPSWMPKSKEPNIPFNLSPPS